MTEENNQNFSDITKITDNNTSTSTMENVPLDDMSSIGKEIFARNSEQENIREALNHQTMIQYRQYAMEKYPKEFIKQEELVIELQNQHFKNYWTNVHLEMLRHQKEQLEQQRAILIAQNGDSEENLPTELDIVKTIVMPACLWTRKNIFEFKSNILAHQKSNCIKIQSLSTATIKVPTHKNGRFLFWEFATDYYDIGFGLSFEWDLAPSENVIVTISESSDEENPDDESAHVNEEEGNRRTEIDTNNTQSCSQTNQILKPPTDELITTYRRECHMEVYCGSHEHPGTGYYILKFDNSYSVWRSKWLYYNVYHTK